MKIEAIPMFDAPTVEVARSEYATQWRQWRSRCPLRRLLPGQEDAIAGDWSEPGGWRTTLDMLKRGLLVEVPERLAIRMEQHSCGVKSRLDDKREPLLDAMRSWIATRPAYPWQKQ